MIKLGLERQGEEFTGRENWRLFFFFFYEETGIGMKNTFKDNWVNKDEKD